MTCKDCIHSEVCDIYYPDTPNPEQNAERCSCFQDKLKFIELPCKVGDTVYFVNDFYEDAITIQEYIVESIHITAKKDKLGRKKQSFVLVRDILYCFLPKRFPFAQFGKTVFLTREEAEKALKERENK